jgi:hypothetical protein
MTATELVKGRVVLANVVKGVFFIKAEDGRIFFCHQSSIRMPEKVPLRFLLEGWEVSFVPSLQHSLQAEEVVVVDPCAMSLVKVNLEAPLLELFDEAAPLKVNESAVYPVYPLDIWGKKGIPHIACEKFQAYWLGEQHLRGFMIRIPKATETAAFSLLDQEKNPRREQEGVIENVSLGSYIVVAKKTDNGFKNGFKVEIFCIGRRIQDKLSGGIKKKTKETTSWLVVERRFQYDYPPVKTLEDILENTPEPPIPDLKRSNSGFSVGILRAIQSIA